MFKNCKKEENKTLEILLKVFLAVGIVAGICVIAKVLYDRYKQKLSLLSDDGDCDFECLDDDALDCDCDTCEYAKGSEEEETVSEENAEEPKEEEAASEEA